MPTELLAVSGNKVILQNVVYALPARRVMILSDAALEVSNFDTFPSSFAVPANTPTEVSGLFVRCTTGNSSVTTRPD